MSARSYLEARARHVYDLPGRLRPRWTVQDADMAKEACDALRVSYPATPVDCLLSELREHYGWGYSGVLTEEAFNERVAQFKAEVAACPPPESSRWERT